jgi:putative tricarboxylic transport membrane protein
VWTDILYGFQVSFTPENLLLCFIGTLIGTLVGVLPGIGPIGAMAILLPASFSLAPLGSFIMLAGIYYGAMYGGSTTSILVNIPGEAASVVTCLDGYQMARKGRAGPALGIAAFGSFIAGTLSIVGLMFLARPLSSVALKFGPPNILLLCALDSSSWSTWRTNRLKRRLWPGSRACSSHGWEWTAPQVSRDLRLGLTN